MERRELYITNKPFRMDDVQDHSPLRRGKPAAHTVFGTAQIINLSSYAMVKSIHDIGRFASPECACAVTGKFEAHLSCFS